MSNELDNSKKHLKRRGWNAKRRANQSKINQKTQPWTKSTGPQTLDGKAASAQNACKHGMRSAAMVELLRLLNEQTRFVRSILD